MISPGLGQHRQGHEGKMMIFALDNPSWHCEPSLGSASPQVKPGMR